MPPEFEITLLARQRESSLSVIRRTRVFAPLFSKINTQMRHRYSSRSHCCVKRGAKRA